jgi:hypothetical protein
MSGFRVIPFPGAPPGSAEFVVYDLDFDDGYAWHQSACQGNECWCQGLSPKDFLKNLYKEILQPAKYVIEPTPPGTGGKNSIRLSMGPGLFTRDDTQLRNTIRDT